MKRNSLPQGEIIANEYKYKGNLKKYIFSRTSWPISIKLGINHRLVKGILNYSNKGPGPLQRGYDYKKAKMGWSHLKIFFSRTAESK
jgi:hypothetical protein